MLLLIFQELQEIIVISGIGRFPAAALPEHELFLFRRFFGLKARIMDINSLLALFAAAQDHLLPLFQVSVFHHLQVSILTDHHAGVHAAFFCQHPPAADLKIFRIHGCTVEIFRCNSIFFHKLPFYLWRAHKLRERKVRVMVFW